MRPERAPDPADAGCNSKLAQYSNTPILHNSAWPDFEDEDEDENEAPHEWHQIAFVRTSWHAQSPGDDLLAPLPGRIVSERLTQG